MNDAFKEMSKLSKYWKQTGPANKRCIDVLSTEENNESEECQKIIKSCMEFLSSDAIFLLLSNLTGLNLHPMASTNSDESSDEENTSEINDTAIQEAGKQGKSRDKINQQSATSSKENDSVEDSTMKCNSKCKPTARRWRQVKCIKFRIVRIKDRKSVV